MRPLLGNFPNPFPKSAKEEYIIVLSTPIADYMTLEDLKRLLEVIDREMADFLQHSTLHPGPRKVPTSLDE